MEAARKAKEAADALHAARELATKEKRVSASDGGRRRRTKKKSRKSRKTRRHR
jgi:hypothetical protein